MYKILNWIIPKLSKTTSKVSTLDTVLSKRGETTRLEVILAFSLEIIGKLFYAWIIWLIITDKLSLGDLAKILLGGFK